MNEREEFWAGSFGDEYNVRSPGNVQANFVLFRKMLGKLIWDQRLSSVVELGCGVGSNLRALRCHLPKAELAGVEINEQAIHEAIANVSGALKLSHCSILEWKPTRTYELAFTKGVLIHIAPEDLDQVYEQLVAASNRYVLIAEYYNPRPVEVPYRGHAGRLWKRDFAGDLIERFGLELIDYGFAYHRDPNPQDDLTWFLMKKPT